MNFMKKFFTFFTLSFLAVSCVIKEKVQETHTVSVKETKSEVHSFSRINCKIEISSEAWAAEKALENNKKLEEIAVLEMQKFPLSDIKFSQTTFKNGKTDYRMFEAKKTITFNAKDFEMVAALCSILRDKGISFPKFEYEIDGEEEIWRNLHSKCLNSLKEKAEMVAAASGYKLGNALSITECNDKTTKKVDGKGNFTFESAFEAVYEMEL